jgi:hypothetical protein
VEHVVPFGFLQTPLSHESPAAQSVPTEQFVLQVVEPQM